MSHIKLFEDFNNNLYQVITQEEYRELHRKWKIINFNKDDIYEINNLPVSPFAKKFRYDSNNSKLNLSIHKLEDYWFLVSSSHTNSGMSNHYGDIRFYKCDDIQGLVSLLFDIELKIKCKVNWIDYIFPKIKEF